MSSNYQQNIYKPQPSESDLRFWEWDRLQTTDPPNDSLLLLSSQYFPATQAESCLRDRCQCPFSCDLSPFLIIKKADNLQGRGSNLAFPSLLSSCSFMNMSLQPTQPAGLALT